MAVKRFSQNFRERTDIFDPITPKTDVQANVSAPAGEWKPAAWLPVEWVGEASKDAFVISSGKVLAFDAQGRVAPAGYRKVAANATAVSDPFLTYTSTDVSYGVTDIRTGVALLSASTGAVSIADVADALLARGIVMESDVEAGFTVAGTYNNTLLQDVQAVLAEWISKPIGVAAYDVFVWAGGEDQNDWANLHHANYQKQALVMFLTDIQMQAPVLVASTQTSAALNTFTQWTAAAGDGSEFPDASSAPAELWLSSTQLAGLTRYSSSVAAGDDVVALQLENFPVARNTDRTPIASSGSLLTRERRSIEAISAAGDWCLDAEVGILFVYEAGGNALPAGTDTISYHYYSSGNAGGHRHLHFVGMPKFGDYVGYDEQSNFMSEGKSPSDMTEVVGRLLDLQVEPRALLDRVRTAWQSSSMSKEAQMPGSATKGYTDLITLSDETVADTVAIVNVKMQ